MSCDWPTQNRARFRSSRIRVFLRDVDQLVQGRRLTPLRVDEHELLFHLFIADAGIQAR